MTRIIVALDVPEIGRAADLAGNLVDVVDGFKVGLELIMGEGPAAISRIADYGLPVFADAKLHDIPNTVESATARLAAAGARWVTVHASGGTEMMEAAISGMGEQGVLAVTVLTSLDHEGLVSIGVGEGMLEQVLRLVELGVSAGVEGVVSSPNEASPIKSRHPELLLFTPGVRPAGAGRDDQSRVTTPAEASKAGADYLVVGRPITRAPDPGEAAREIASSIARVA